jgi:hypothetical protein
LTIRNIQKLNNFDPSIWESAAAAVPDYRTQKSSQKKGKRKISSSTLKYRGKRKQIGSTQEKLSPKTKLLMAQRRRSKRKKNLEDAPTIKY